MNFRSHNIILPSSYALRFHNARNIKRLPLTTVRSRRRRLVGQDLLDLLHDLGSDLGKQLHGLAVVLNLGDLGGAENDGADVGVHHAPVQMLVRE
jgi:hypothetical protein